MAFCGKCGTQLSDGAKFCPKCGTPTIRMQGGSSSSSNSSNCSIELISAGAARLVVVKALVDELGLGINDAKTLVDSTPCVLADGLSLSRAKELAQLLSKTGSKIAVNQNGKTIFVEEPSIEEESQTEEHNWGKYLQYAGYAFIALCLLYLFGVFDNDSSSNKSEKAQTEKRQESSSKEQTDETKQEVSHAFFENGYRYTASYRINRQQGHGISCNYNYTIEIYKDGTTEITDESNADGFENPTVTRECKIEKKSNSYKDVAATWYEITWDYGSSYGGKFTTHHAMLYVDEKGNIIHLHENGNQKDIHQAIASGDCIFGKFNKRPI